MSSTMNKEEMEQLWGFLKDETMLLNDDNCDLETSFEVIMQVKLVFI